MKVLVVDDEPPARRRMIRMLAAFDDVEVVGEAGDGPTAVDSITRLRPDVVLLDIEMPGLDGLTVAELAIPGPAIVFVTAHERYAAGAFEIDAVDYLLKPVKAPRLRRALERVRGRQLGADQLRELLSGLGRKRDHARISARDGTAVRLFDAAQIRRITAADKYTAFVHDGREYVLDDSLSDLEARLADHGFVRVHRAELVNLDHVRALHTSGNTTEIELSTGERVAVSRRMLPELKRRLGL